MEKEKSKEELLSELYAIRATMSLVSKKDDEAEPTRKELMNRKNSIDRMETELRNKSVDNMQKSNMSERKCSNLTKDIENYNNAIANKQEQLEQCDREINEHNEKINYWKNKKIKLKDRKGLYIDLPLKPIVIFSIIGVLFGISALGAYISKEPIPALIYLILSIIILTLVIGLSSYYVKTRIKTIKISGEEEEKRKVLNTQSQLRYELSNLNNKVSDLERKLAEEKSATSAEREFVKQYTQSQKEALRKKQEEIPFYRQKLVKFGLESQAIIDSAKEAYPTIDYRDWGNVDLLIFYFETGRAESLKEALQLVDRQRQTDEIVSAIEYASKAISMTIESSTKKLGQALALSFERLSAQLDKQHREVMASSEKQHLQQESLAEKFDALNSNMQGLSKSMEKSAGLQISSQQMQTALLQKIDRSSADLKEDMEKQLRYVHGIYY